MNDAQSLIIEHEDALGWRYVMRDVDDTPVLMSTKYYVSLQEVVEDLQSLQGLLDAV
jgi:hypothetical protein